MLRILIQWIDIPTKKHITRKPTKTCKCSVKDTFLVSGYPITTGRERQQQLQDLEMNNPNTRKSGFAVSAHISEARRIQHNRHKEFATHICVCKPDLEVMHIFVEARERVRLAQTSTDQLKAGRAKTGQTPQPRIQTTEW